MNTRRESLDSRILEWSGVALAAFLVGSFALGAGVRGGAAEGLSVSRAAQATPDAGSPLSVCEPVQPACT
jgi:hypothetical protein